MDTDREAQHRRLTEPHRSKSAKLAWKRHRDSYMRANRKKERDNMNKSFYTVAKEIEESLNKLNEIQVDDNIFDLEAEYTFDNLAGGINFKINKESGDVSFSTSMVENGQGNYRLETTPDDEQAYKDLYNDLKDEMQLVCSTIENSMKQILAKHGLRRT